MANTATIAWFKNDSNGIANPNTFNFYRRNQPIIGLKSKVDNTTFNYYRRNQPLQPMVVSS